MKTGLCRSARFDSERCYDAGNDRNGNVSENKE